MQYDRVPVVEYGANDGDSGDEGMDRGETGRLVTEQAMSSSPPAPNLVRRVTPTTTTLAARRLDAPNQASWTDEWE